MQDRRCRPRSRSRVQLAGGFVGARFQLCDRQVRDVVFGHIKVHVDRIAGGVGQTALHTCGTVEIPGDIDGTKLQGHWKFQMVARQKWPRRDAAKAHNCKVHRIFAGITTVPINAIIGTSI